MSTTISNGVARTRPELTASTQGSSVNLHAGSGGEAHLQFQADRNSDSFERVRTAGGAAGAGRLEGFDAQKLGDPNHQTPKYIVGRILQNYPNTPEGLREAIKEIQRFFPEARIAGNKGDCIDFGSHTDPEGRPLGKIDVIRAAGGPNGGEAWQWLPAGASGGGGGASEGAAAVGGGAGNTSGFPGGFDLSGLFAFLESPEGQRLLGSIFGGVDRGALPSR